MDMYMILLIALLLCSAGAGVAAGVYFRKERSHRKNAAMADLIQSQLGLDYDSMTADDIDLVVTAAKRHNAIGDENGFRAELVSRMS